MMWILAGRGANDERFNTIDIVLFYDGGGCMKHGETKWLTENWGLSKGRLATTGKTMYWLVFCPEMQAISGMYHSKRQAIVSLKRTFIACGGSL